MFKQAGRIAFIIVEGDLFIEDGPVARFPDILVGGEDQPERILQKMIDVLWGKGGSGRFPCCEDFYCEKLARINSALFASSGARMAVLRPHRRWSQGRSRTTP